jgi:hypothetical protein
VVTVDDDRNLGMIVQMLALVAPEDLPGAREGFMEAQLQKGVGEDEAGEKWTMLMGKVDEWRALEAAAGN